MNSLKALDLSLSSKMAISLLDKHGYNEIITKDKNKFLKAFFSQFNNFLILLLIVSSVISFVIGERLDAYFIFGIVIINACFGLFQEFKAEKSLASLKKITLTKVRVIRDRKESEIDSKLLVPDDIIYLEEGSKVPTDCVLINTNHFEVDEASLTGESLPVIKNESDTENNQIFMGTVVVRGRAYAKVVKTGSNTRLGKIAKTLSEIKEVKTPLQKKLEHFTKQIGYLGIGASIVVFGLSFIRDKTVLEGFLLAVSLAVAAVPEGLPAVMTIILSIGVENMAKKKTIVRKLNAIETMGSLTLIATDKTGTLTTNKMRVKKTWAEGNLALTKIYINSCLCSTASLVKKIDHGRDYDIVGDTTEGALLIMAKDASVDYEEERNKVEIIDEIAFSSITKRMSVVVKTGGKHTVYTKGAPESILPICTHIQVGNKVKRITKVDIKKIRDEFERYAQEGLRIMAFSYKQSVDKKLETDQIFLGFVGISDPVRPEVFEAVNTANKAGIKVVMITGDNELTAEAVGIETGIIKKGEDILTGKILRSYTDDDLLEILPRVKIFARTAPEDKFRIVSLYQKLGETVAVTGDGVNDALALKQADVGVAMGITGTDVAKDTAHIIITDDNFATLISAIEQGRNIFLHIKNAIKYLLACNVSEVIYMILALIFRLPVLTPLQLLYMNVITDGLPAISLAFSPHNQDVINHMPRKSLTILEKKDFNYIYIVSLIIVFLTGATYYFFRSQTVIFTILIFLQHIILIDVYLSHRSIFKEIKYLKNPIFIIAFFLPFILHPILIYSNSLRFVFEIEILEPRYMFMLALYSSAILFFVKIFKKSYI